VGVRDDPRHRRCARRLQRHVRSRVRLGPRERRESGAAAAQHRDRARHPRPRAAAAAASAAARFTNRDTDRGSPRQESRTLLVARRHAARRRSPMIRMTRWLRSLGLLLTLSVAGAAYDDPTEEKTQRELEGIRLELERGLAGLRL